MEEGRAMDLKNRRPILLLFVAVPTIASMGWAAQGVAKLIMNGKLASTDVRMISGRPYVPLADIAKAQGMVVLKRDGAYEIAAAGGANQLAGQKQGKMGDELFTGKWKIQITGYQQLQEYTEKFCQDRRTLYPSAANEMLVVVNCRIKNGIKEAKSPILSERMPGNTLLADDQGGSYPPIDFDAAQLSGKMADYAAKRLLPGAGADFALVFSVPADTKPKSLVFSVLSYPDDVGGKGTDVRVELSL